MIPEYRFTVEHKSIYSVSNFVKYAKFCFHSATFSAHPQTLLYGYYIPDFDFHSHHLQLTDCRVDWLLPKRN